MGPRILLPDEFREYLNRPPLEPPEGMSLVEATRLGLESGDWSVVDIYLRKVGRLVLSAARRSRVVCHWLLATKRQYDAAYENLLSAIEHQTPSLWKQMVSTVPSDMVLKWSVYCCARYIIQDEFSKKGKI